MTGKVVVVVLLGFGSVFYFMIKSFVNAQSAGRKLTRGLIILIVVAILGFVLSLAYRDLASNIEVHKTPWYEKPVR